MKLRLEQYIVNLALSYVIKVYVIAGKIVFKKKYKLQTKKKNCMEVSLVIGEVKTQ